MATIHDTDTNKLVNKASIALKKMIKKPDWAQFVRTGVSKDRPPVDNEWWYKRAAAILRSVYLRGPIGTNKLRMKYSSKKNRGTRPEKTFRAGGKIIRVILQQLETAKLIEKGEKGVYKGRIITPQGKSFLDKNSK